MTPFKPNQQKEIEKKEKTEKKNMKNNAELKQKYDQIEKGIDPLLQLTISQPIQQQPAQNPIYPSPYVPIQNPYLPIMNNGNMPWNFTPNNVPVIKKYNIIWN